MPIECVFDVRPLTQEEFGELDYRVMRHAFACQNGLGRFCEENAYQCDLQSRLRVTRRLQRTTAIAAGTSTQAASSQFSQRTRRSNR
jgi:hypothetical protein